MTTSVDWNDENIDILKRFWLIERWSASRIAGLIPKATRSAIIGKVHRLKLGGHITDVCRPDPRKQNGMTRGTVRKRKAPHMNGQSVFAEADEESDVAPIEYLKLEDHHCRALLDERGSDGLPLCCGRMRLRWHFGYYASQYCPAHDRLYAPGRSNPQGNKHGKTREGTRSRSFAAYR